MKGKAIIAAAILALSVSGLVSAKQISSDGYTPPERLTCSNVNDKVSCQGFNRSYLVEDNYIADFKGTDHQTDTYLGALSRRTVKNIFYVVCTKYRVMTAINPKRDYRSPG